MARKVEPYVTIAEAARLSGLSPYTIYHRIHSGEVPAYGRRHRFRVQMSDVLPVVDLSKPVHHKGRNLKPFDPYIRRKTATEVRLPDSNVDIATEATAHATAPTEPR